MRRIIVSYGLACTAGIFYMASFNLENVPSNPNPMTLLNLRLKEDGSTNSAKTEEGGPIHPSSEGNHHHDPIVVELEEALDWKRLNRIARNHRSKYLNARPFPHMVLDDLFPASILIAIEQEIPESNLDKEGCMKGSNYCFKRKTDYLKSTIEKEGEMGHYTRILIGYLKSATFTTFLQRLTGISGIIPDPEYAGSGLHITSAKGHLNIHADFNWNNNLKLDRRVNTFIYLNPDWKDEYGGHLELWNRNMTRCQQRILPIMGRFVVFSSTDFSYHGHPQPLTPPEGRARRSIALYYYTNGRPEEECLNNTCDDKSHGTLFQIPQGCKLCQEGTCNAFKS
mmetsp:Transcript_12910/g.19753  ORF Transcript_12910/g.19753 Transcript_12910/m.19753 type:complete len:339 (-) Transcript_12910:592-1608(-)